LFGSPVNSIVYQIPVAQLESFRGRRLIVRTRHPSDLPAQLHVEDLHHVAYVQLYGLPDNVDALMHWAEGLPIDLLLDDPAQDFANLYRFAKLLDNHPVRVSLPVSTGFDKAVKLASSLQFEVRLQLGQPEALQIELLARLLDDYLHKATVMQPIEFFHSLLLGFCNQIPVSLWAIQEEHPALLRHVDEQGNERLPGKLASFNPNAASSAELNAELAKAPERFVAEWSRSLLAEGAECSSCGFFSVCQGYFKWPRRDYQCVGVKTLFTTLEQAGDELREDLEAAAAEANP
jgi:hypothetical protein